MNYIKYEIKQGDTLISIAKENNISVEKMLEFHNKNSDLTHQIYSEKIPFHITTFLLDFEFKKKQNDKSDSVNILQVDKKARYRCEQFNVTKVEDNVTFHCNTKKEYTLEIITVR